MSSMMISYQIVGCLLLISLSQYAETKKPYYLETILKSLQHLESILVKQTEQNTLCVVPAKKLRSLISEYQTSNESNENNIEYLLTPKKLKRQRKNKNENVNANINENLNKNYNAANQHHRRSFGSGDSHLSKTNRNQNINSNVNLNSNLITSKEDEFDFSDEDEV